MYKTNQREHIVFGISLAFMLGLFVCIMFMMYHRALEYQKSLIGAIYQLDSEACETYLDTAFRVEVNETQLDAGTQALKKYGYTEQGIDFLMGHVFPETLWAVMGACVILCLGVQVLLFVWRKKTMYALALQLRKLQREKEQLQYRMQYLEGQNGRVQTFIENVSHQIKTPISRVMTSLDMMLETMIPGAQTERVLEGITHLEAVKTLITRLLDVSRLEAGKVEFRKERFQVKELLLDSVSAVMETPEQVKLSFSEEREAMCFDGDYQWLKEALTNLLKNCKEHDTGEQPIEITCGGDREYLLLRIRDRGTGFCEADMPHLFDRFYQPEQEKKGHVGIGLNLTKLIVEAHFGTIRALNHEESGAVFEILLPFYPIMSEKI